MRKELLVANPFTTEKHQTSVINKSFVCTIKTPLTAQQYESLQDSWFEEYDFQGTNVRLDFDEVDALPEDLLLVHLCSSRMIDIMNFQNACLKMFNLTTETVMEKTVKNWDMSSKYNCFKKYRQAGYDIQKSREGANKIYMLY